MTRIFVSHPLLQHAHQLAMGLHERGLLKALWCGTPLLGPGEQPSPWTPPKLAARMRRVSIPASMRCHPIWPQLLIRATRHLPGIDPGDWAHRIFHAYDVWVSRRLAKLKPDIVVAFENSAYHTFTEARRLGIRCVLDAPSLHHVPSDLLINTPQTAFRREINRRKDQEVDLAERILTCSSMAADTYAEQGVSRSKLVPMLLGAETEHLAAVRLDGHGDAAPLFVFAGGLGYRKSTDLILEAFERLASAGQKFRLLFVGGCDDPAWLERILRLPGAEYRPGQPQSELFKIFVQADCLLLPSRFDSFGMVVAEAMACGIPAIVSTRTGAKEIIERHPGSGWIVEPSSEGVHDVVLSLIQSPARLLCARAVAQEAAREFTWRAYRSRVGDLFESMARGH